MRHFRILALWCAASLLVALFAGCAGILATVTADRCPDDVQEAAGVVWSAFGGTGDAPYIRCIAKSNCTGEKYGQDGYKAASGCVAGETLSPNGTGVTILRHDDRPLSETALAHELAHAFYMRTPGMPMLPHHAAGSFSRLCAKDETPKIAPNPIPTMTIGTFRSCIPQADEDAFYAIVEAGNAVLAAWEAGR